MTQNLAIDKLRSLSDLAGLDLSDGELQRLAPGVKRSRKQVEELRELIKANDEPAGTFIAAHDERKS
jgi:hypothetical protein